MWRHLTSLLLAAILVAGACSADVESGPVVNAEGCHPAVAEALAGWEVAGFSGTVAFVDTDRPCVAAFGSIDPLTGAAMTTDAVFSIGSITKAVTAAAIAGLEFDGRLSYDDRAGDLVPGLDGPVADATIGQLLLHTSGITGTHGRDHQPLARADALAALSTLDTASEPGTTFGYANAGYATLALVVDEVTGSYRDHLVDEILLDADGRSIGGFWDGEPAAPEPRAVGLADDGAPGVDGSFAGPHWALDGAGGVAMTAEQLADWTAALFQGHIIDPEAVERLLDLRFDHEDGTEEVPGWVAIDEVPFGEPVFGASGGGGGIGHQMTTAWLPESERVFVVAVNTPDVGAEQLLAALLPDLAAGLAPAAPPVASEIAPDVIEAVTGRWELADGSRFDVAAAGPGLRVRALDPGAVSVVLPQGDPAVAADHQRRVLEVIGGSTAEGRQERELFEEAFGPIGEVEPFGTAFIEGEHRTWLRVHPVEGDPVLVWLALQPNDAIAAAESGTEPPSTVFLQSDDGTLAPLDQTTSGEGPRLLVDDLALGDMELRIATGDDEVVATRSG